MTGGGEVAGRAPEHQDPGTDAATDGTYADSVARDVVDRIGFTPEMSGYDNRLLVATLAARRVILDLTGDTDGIIGEQQATQGEG